ncbi:unnamed protein product [Arctia plantaginis]|uniref:Protein singed wings 2 n=1 Tax=Arctia plantaginis TaxID=874455 RepID=A0A8S1BNI8_ARCPL|nr:unnamed protein product [Arctia plantaginis]CAB3261374.1 unnamed protein product [Arctia plantaginis]
MKTKALLQVVMLYSAVKAVTPGFQYTSKNSSDAIGNQPCSLGDYISKARCQQSEFELICTAGFTAYWIRGMKREITHLRLVDWPGDCFNIGHLEFHYPELLILEFINSTSLRYFKGHFSALNKIQKLTVHGMPHLWEIPAEVVSEMGELREINLKGNMLRHMKARLLAGPRRLERVYLKGNNWDCNDGGLDWLAMEPENGTLKRKIADYYDLVCQQQLYKGKPLHIVMDIIKTIRRTCPDPCSCTMTHIVSDTAGAVIPLITVNCAYKKLESPPASLPPGTTTLRLEGNKLKSIAVIMQNIISNPQYKKLVDLYLDNNSISAVKELEGTEWFTTFRVLSLRGNLLKQIQIFAFDKAFQANNNLMHVFLGDNPWRCDCLYIPRFQNFLLKYKRVLRDQNDIRCSKTNDRKTSLVQINKIPLGNICSSDDVELPISYINIINLVLLALILIIVARFLYDRHNFIRTGKLPWLSSILP